MIVDFMIIGAQKCGTTSLANQLASNRQVCFCRIKEPAYFNETIDWRGKLAEYHALYSPENGQLCGEASTMYTFLPEYRGTHERLYEYNAQLKFIYLMRNPVERIESHYAHNLVRNLVKAPLEQAVFTDSAYISRSRYATQLRPYIDLYGRERILPLVFEEYVRDQEGTLRTIERFLGLDDTTTVIQSDVHHHSSTGTGYLKHSALRSLVATDTFQRIRNRVPAPLRRPIRRHLSNQIDEKPTIPPALRRELWNYVVDDVAYVEALMGKRLDVWRYSVQHDTLNDALHTVNSVPSCEAAS